MYYRSSFCSSSVFLFTDESYGKNVIIFGADMSSSVHVDHKGKYILILGEEPTQGLDDTTLTAETKYSVNCTQSGKIFVLSLHYNWSNSFLLVNATKLYQFNANTSKIKCPGNVSKDFTINNMKKTWLKGVVRCFSVDFNPIDTNDILDIHKYLMKRIWYKVMFGLIKKIFIGLLTGLVNVSNHTKYISLCNQNCMIQTTLINLHPYKYSQEFQYYPFSVKLDRCVASCNTINDLANNVYIPNKTEHLNLSVFNIITKINKSKTLTKHISCKCKCKFDGTKCDSNQWWNNDKCRWECKKHHIYQKDYVLNPPTYNCENGKYLASIMDDLTIICDEVIKLYNEVIKTIPTNFNEKNITLKTQSFYILLTFLLITTILLTAVTIYCYLIKYQGKQKHHFMVQN